MTRCVVARRLNTLVQVGEDEIECVQSLQSHASTEELYDAMYINEEDETHSLSYCTTQEGPAQPKDTEEGNAKGEMAIASLSFSSLEILDDLQEKQFSLDDIRILQEEMKDLRAEIEQTKDLDADKRCKMETVFYQVEGALKVNEEMIESSSGEEAESPSNEFTPSAIDHVRRTTVVITGGTLTVVGAALIPCPVIPGCLILYGGLMVLATEFDSAKKALNTIKEPIEKWLDDDDMEEDPKNAAEDENLCNSLLWEGLVGYTPSDEKCKNEIDDEFLAMMGMNRKKNDGSVDSGKAKKKNPIKPYLRKLFTSMNSSMESDSGKRNDGAADHSEGSKQSVSDNCNRHNVVKSNSSPCHSDISGCQMFTFDYGRDGDVKDEHNDINFQRLRNKDDMEAARLFSRQSTTLSRQSSSYGYGDGDCLNLWVDFSSCNAFLPHKDSQ